MGSASCFFASRLVSLRQPRRAGLVALALAVLALAGCATVPPPPPIPVTGDPVIDGKARFAAAPEKDKVLWEYRTAAAALRRGQPDEAKTLLDDALARTAGTLSSANSAEAAKARKLFRNEADKPFVGEPYERVMANFYRGLLYWRDGEPDNARALFRSGQFIDSDTEDKTYAGDYVLLEYLDGFITSRLDNLGAGQDALARARKLSRRTLPDYSRAPNVLFFVEYGKGPTKYAGGEHGEQLRFFVEQSRAVSARLQVDRQVYDLSPYDDLNYQATTRGGRVMDHILGNKAVFKRNTDAIGDVALAGAIGTAAYGRGEDAGNAALALAAVGLISKLASAATQTAADTRSWDNLPQYLSFAAVTLPAGEHPARLTFLDEKGATLGALTQEFTVSVPASSSASVAGDQRRDVIVFRSTLNR